MKEDQTDLPVDQRRPRGRAALALLLIAPAPTVGVVAGLAAAGPMGTAVWAAAKVWLFGLPVAWRTLVDRRPISWSPMKKGGIAAGMITGVVICVAIIAAYWAAAPWIDREAMRQIMDEAGLSNPWIYVAGCAYWICVNSVLEEYVYRWFIHEKLEEATGTQRAGAMTGRMWAIVVAGATIFTVHHAVAMAVMFDWWIAAVASAGVFIGGATWSVLYVKYRSIWPAWISHAWADVGVFAVGAWLIFG